MAVGFPAKTNFATGDVLTATNMNDVTGTLNLLQSTLYPAGRNRIINGDFNIWQRGTTGTTGYVADRFSTFVSTTTASISQQTFTPGTAPVSGYEGAYFIRQVVTSGGTASSRCLFEQKMEDVRTYAGQTVTASFWAKADAAKNISLEITQQFGSGGSAAVNTFVAKQAITTSWVRYSFTFTIPSIAGKTIGTSSLTSLIFWLDAGSDWAARTGSLGNQSGTFDIWGVQLEAGSTASPFQTASGSIAGELALCQRYYTRTTSESLYAAVGLATTYSTTNANSIYSYPVTMRVAPTAVDYSNLQVAGNGFGGTITTITLSSYYNKQFVILDIVGTGFTANLPAYIRANNSLTSYLGFSAELQEITMDNVTFIEIEGVEHAIIDRGNWEFTSMLKSTYDELSALEAASK